MLPQEIFEISHAVMTILVLFEHFLGKLCLNFLTLILSRPTSPNIMHFLRTFSIISVLALRLIVISVLALRLIVTEEVQNYGKIVLIKNIVEKGW